MNILAVAWCLLVLLATAKAQAPPSCADSDLVLRNGKIITMNLTGDTAEALAVRDGKIVAVGSNEVVAPCTSSRTRRVDLGGRTVLPGLIDVHTHAMEWAKGVVRGDIDAGFPGVRSINDIVAAVRRRAAEVSPGEWIVGSGWDDAKLNERRYVTRADLDSISPQNPVYLVHVSGHLAVANSAALALAGITRDTPSPTGGVIEHDSGGQPTGVLLDSAMGMVARLLPRDPPGLARRAAKMVSDKALEVGLTTIHDIWVSPENMRSYQEAHQAGDLQVRVQMVPGVRSVEDAERLAGMGIHTGFGDAQLRIGAVKLFADGGMGARTVAIYPPPVAGEPENFGLLIWKSEDLQKAHRILAAAGWQIVTHAIGDRAINQVLDSYAATKMALQLEEPRFRIAHCGISTPAIQKRLREMRVLVDGNPPFVYWIGSWFRKYGPERVRWSYPGKSYFDNGIIAGGASDVDVTPINPWWGIWAAVERKELLSGKALAPEERLTVKQALTLYTRNGAYIGFEETQKGSLETGKLADFIVVDRDVVTIPAAQLKDTQVLQTYVGGRLVYERK